MNSISPLSLLLFLTLFLTLTVARPDKPTTNPVNLIPIACKNSTKPLLCISVLNAVPTAKTADLKGLAFIALKTAASKAAATSAHVKAAADKGCVEEPELEDALRDCAESYLDVVDQIEDSADELVLGRLKNVDTWVRAAVADVVTCDGNVKGQQSGPSAKKILEKNDVVKDLCNNALEVVHVLAKYN